MLTCDPTATYTDTTNKGFIARWIKIKQRKEVQFYGRLHSYLCKVPLYLLPGIRLQIKLTKARPSFYLINETADSKTIFRFLDAQLIVKSIKPHHMILLSHHTTLENGFLARYNFTKVELKSFTFSSGSKYLSIDNAALGPIPKRLFFTMENNSDFNGSLDTNPFTFRHYDINHFTLLVNGKQVTNEGLPLVTDHKKTSVMGYKSLFEGCGIRHSNSGLQITHMYISGYFMLLFDLTPDQGASEGHASHAENCNIRIELRFNKPLPDAITCLLYLEFDNSVRINKIRTVSTDF